jgi:hypothetical protein
LCKGVLTGDGRKRRIEDGDAQAMGEMVSGDLAMSWDLIVFDGAALQLSGPDGRALIADGWQPPEMGSAPQLRQKITEAFSDVLWDDIGWGLLDAPEFSLQFALGRHELVTSFSIYARGLATPAVVHLMQSTRWRVLDIGTGKWLDPKADPDEGRRKFQGYLDKVNARLAHAAQPPEPKRWIDRLCAAILRR